MYLCQICKQYARVSLKEIIRHIRDMHRHFTTPVRCGVDGCPSTATSYDSLRQHTYKKHRNELIPEDHSNFVPIASFEDNAEPESQSVFTEEGSHIPASSTPSTASAATQSATLEAARFILKLRDGKGLPQTVTDSILKDIQVMIDSTNDNLKRKITEYLLDVNKLSCSEISRVQEIFSSEKAIFDGLESVRNQELYIQEHFDYVVLAIILLYCSSVDCSIRVYLSNNNYFNNAYSCFLFRHHKKSFWQEITNLLLAVP